MSSPFFQSLDPQGAPDPVTPQATPSHPEGYNAVTPPGTGAAPAPYDISAPQNIAGITAAFNAATALTGGDEGADTGAGMPDRFSPRQAEARAILESPQGAPGMNVLSGFPDYEAADVRPTLYDTPIQGHTSDYPGTTQPGVPQFTAGFESGMPGVSSDNGSMAPSSGGDYPGTTQNDLPVYGLS
jgi:hypothetical protein